MTRKTDEWYAARWASRSKEALSLYDRIDQIEIHSLSEHVRRALREAYVAGMQYARLKERRESPPAFNYKDAA